MRLLLAAEFSALRDRLHDLLPQPIAERRAAAVAGGAGAGAVCVACEAAVLQLDLCQFTAWSQVDREKQLGRKELRKAR